ncbi:hypothetical protein Ahy_Scaffold6g108228 [Arachis hypogaea]|uniref:SGF29 C-terminal domain-containing protein n=1 Tax=Arachis hypogaea TaxID=3818 RepID=A0A444WPY1_ARAHY|nr:hypothetical protein Ahy_Scaffold6g108228 [Arachis hypogaea]
MVEKMSSPNIAAMLDKTEELDLIIKEQEVILLKINDLNEKLKTSPQVVENPDDNSLELLKVWYTQAMNLSNCEANICDLLANQLDALLELQQPSPPLPRLPPLPQQQKRMAKARVEQPKRQKQVKSLSNPSSITGSLEGKEVAAKVMPQNFEKEEWIIARVVCFDEESKEFEVVDEEPDNGDAKEVESGEEQIALEMKRVGKLTSCLWARRRELELWSSTEKELELELQPLTTKEEMPLGEERFSEEVQVGRQLRPRIQAISTTSNVAIASHMETEAITNIGSEKKLKEAIKVVDNILEAMLS